MVLNAFWFMGTNDHNQPQHSQKSMCARNKIAHVEFLRGDTRLVRGYAVTATHGNRERSRQKKIFVFWKKTSKTKEKFYNNDFRKIVIYNSIPDALRDLHASECKRPHNRTYDGCLWKAAKRNKVHTSKQLQLAASTETFNGNQDQGQPQQT